MTTDAQTQERAPKSGERWIGKIAGREVVVRVTRVDERIGSVGTETTTVYSAVNETNPSSRTLVWTRERFLRPADEPETLTVEQELEAAIDGDDAVAYFARTVRERLEAGVVDAAAYVLETRRALDADEEKIQELGFAGELQTDQIVEKMRRLEAKRTVLQILGDELSAPAGPAPSDRCVNCGGYADPATAVDDEAAGCSCIGDYAPAWKRDDVATLERRDRALDRIIEGMRDEQSRREGEEVDAFRARLNRWRVEWDARFAERRWIATRLAELQEVAPSTARELAVRALEVAAASRETMALDHYCGGEAGVDLLREANALRRVAEMLAGEAG